MSAQEKHYFPEWHKHEMITTRSTLLWPQGLIGRTAEVCRICGIVKSEVLKILKRRDDHPPKEVA